MNSLYVGIDVSSKDNAVYLMKPDGAKHSSFSVQNNLNGAKILSHKVVSAITNSKLDSVIFGLESTSVYGEHLVSCSTGYMFVNQPTVFAMSISSTYRFLPFSSDYVNLPKIEVQAAKSDGKYMSEELDVLLRVAKEVMGTTMDSCDNFYHSGGDSIAAIQISSLLKKKGYVLKIKDILEHPDLGEMSEYIVCEKEDSRSDSLCSGDIKLTPMGQLVWGSSR